jgi:gluconate 2-dehydrogenase gamma chain
MKEALPMFEADTIDRRDAMARIALLLGAASLPADAFAQSAKAKPYLAAGQFALLSAVADTVMPATDTPGALAAKVPTRLDAMLGAWAAPATRDAIGSALVRIEDAAKAKTGKSFAKLNAKQREAVLRPHDAAALAKTGKPTTSGKFPFGSYIPVADPAYLRLKTLIVDLYYYSPEATATELVYEHVPGKYEPSIKLTPKSRPYLGVGPF